MFDITTANNPTPVLVMALTARRLFLFAQLCASNKKTKVEGTRQQFSREVPAQQLCCLMDF